MGCGVRGCLVSSDDGDPEKLEEEEGGLEGET